MFLSNVSESPYDLLMLSYQGNIVLLESEEMQTADLRRTVLAVTAITHTLRECFKMINTGKDLFTAILISAFFINIFSNIFCLYLILQMLKKIIIIFFFCSVSTTGIKSNIMYCDAPCVPAASLSMKLFYMKNTHLSRKWPSSIQ